MFVFSPLAMESVCRETLGGAGLQGDDRKNLGSAFDRAARRGGESSFNTAIPVPAFWCVPAPPPKTASALRPSKCIQAMDKGQGQL